MGFDRYVAVDWSASATPKTGANSIWIAQLSATGSVELTNPATRVAAEASLAEIISASGRVLIGIDASFGYPRGSAAHFGLVGDRPWRAAWDAISSRSTDDAGNRTNRFEVAAALNALGASDEGPFWGCPTEQPLLRRTKPPGFDVPEFRVVEERLRSSGRFPKSAWQLLGAGSVGSQTLTVIPMLRRLLDRAAVWPFTTGLRRPGEEHRVVVAEVWPSLFLRRVPTGMVPDAAHVAATVEAIRDADRSGALSRWFTPGVDDPAPVVDEEGWILGVETGP